MSSWVELVANHPANAALVRYFEPRFERRKLAVVCRPEDVKDPYYGLGTHPDLVERLWGELGKALVVDCRAVFYGNPALIHPTSGVVFGFAGGTHTYGRRTVWRRMGALPVVRAGGGVVSRRLRVGGK